MLQVDEARAVYNVGSLEEKVLVKTWILGLRIGDACRLEWKQFDVTPTENLVEILVHTRKEGIVAHVFLDTEFQRLLEKHIPNLDQKNLYLFQSERGEHLSEKQLLRKLQGLKKRAQVKAKGRFGWHIARKLFLRVCAENGVISWNAKLLIGKSVDKSIATYIDGVSLRRGAEKVSRVLHMESLKSNHRVPTLEEAMDLVLRTLRKMCMRELESEGYKEGLGILRDYTRLTHREILEEFLKED